MKGGERVRALRCEVGDFRTTTDQTEEKGKIGRPWQTNERG